MRTSYLGRGKFFPPCENRLESDAIRGLGSISFIEQNIDGRWPRTRGVASGLQNCYPSNSVAPESDQRLRAGEGNEEEIVQPLLCSTNLGVITGLRGNVK